MTIPSTITNKAMLDQTEIDGYERDDEPMLRAREAWVYGLFCLVAIAGLSWFALFAFGVIW